MKASRLRLNAFKTQVMWLGTSQQLAKIAVRDVLLLSTVVIVIDSVRHLGVIIDSQLYRRACCRSLPWRLLPVAATTSGLCRCRQKPPRYLVHALVSSRLDYCNTLLYGVADGLYRRLQSVQNAAARLVFGFTAP